MNGGPFELIHISLDRKMLPIPTLEPTDTIPGEARYNLGFQRKDGQKFFLNLSRDEGRFFLGETL